MTIRLSLRINLTKAKGSNKKLLEIKTVPKNSAKRMYLFEKFRENFLKTVFVGNTHLTDTESQMLSGR